MKPVLKAFLLLVVLVVVLGAAAYWYVVTTGLSARGEPGRVEELIARTVRNNAVARHARQLTNPVTFSDEAIAEGREHFADHCATCHANDGSGDTEMGRSMWPKAPDMRLAATQELSDGELFYIIENGIRFTGMAAWGNGTPEGETASWRLVHFIRRLPKLTPAEIEEMEALNPRSRDEWREEEEARRFLEGDDKDAPKSTAPEHKHGG